MNALAVAAVVVMLSFKRRDGGITFHVFAHSCDLEIDPMTFIYELYPVCRKDVPNEQNLIFCVKAFESYHCDIHTCYIDRQRDRQTDIRR